MSTRAELERQKTVFKQAYEQGRISKQQYMEAIASTQQQIIKLSSQKTATTPLPTAGKAYVEGSWKPVETAPAEHREALKAQTQASAFYASVGKPELAFKYAAPDVPEGYEAAAVREVTGATRPPLTVQEALVPTEPHVEVTLKPKEVYAPTQLFGPKTEFYSMTEGRFVAQEIGYGKSAKRITIGKEKGMSLMESQAVSGLGLAAVTATGMASPVLGAFGLSGVGVAEGVKVGVTGKHLTPEEAIGAAGIGQLVGAGVIGGAKAFQPRVQKSVDASFRKAVESQQIWKPSLAEKLSMKVTGAKAPRLAQEIVGAGEPRGISLSMIKKGEFVGAEESYFWDIPTPKTTQVYVRGFPATKSWVSTTLVKRVYLEGLFTTPVATKLLLETPSKLEPKMPYIPRESYISRAVSVLPSSIGLAPMASLSLLSKAQQKMLTRQVQRQTTRRKLIQESKEAIIVSEIVTSIQAQKQSTRQVQQLVPIQIQNVSQVQKQIIATLTPNIPKMQALPKAPFFPLGGGGAGTRSFDRLTGKWFLRKHKVKPWDKMLKTFGFGKVTGKMPKGVMQISKMEVPSFGKVKLPKISYGKSAKKRKRRKRGKRV